ncbi:aromatic ring-hydroxylating dioxygenase subunit alpha [Variovorax gossypii]|uniref:Aromatic ring-hydroxylating dioxygenase subunit alpha n=1 Tax=Variovorax gossypii TaxID=1679495 RepID=A0A431TEJ1_9BURK|nr:aromatic ring-hydroxylating dioxygenase subunit alpha [Variovorax gossypii]RTQ31656.1 aromatic ring-hydroxylating dioxygenase subunit alpha [Variovorax gossypii]
MPFVTDDPNMLDDWLVVGPAPAPSASRATRLLGEAVLLSTDADGMPHCSLGDMQLAVQPRYGYLWVCPSGRPARPLFDFPEYGEPGRRLVDCGGIGVAVSGLRVIENFLDMAHFPFVHADYLGKVPHTEVAQYQVQVEPSTGEIWATDCRFWQPRASAAHDSSGSEVLYKYRVMQPFSAMLYKSSFRAGELDAIGLFLQPVDDEHVIAHTLLACYDDGSTDAELIAFQHTIFGQDKPILENHAFKRMPLEGRAETPTRGDTSSVTYRRWLRERGMRFGVRAAA